MNTLIPANELNPTYVESLLDKAFAQMRQTKSDIAGEIAQAIAKNQVILTVTIINKRKRETIRKWLSMYGYIVKDLDSCKALSISLTQCRPDPDKLPL